ncbi:GGDEF domain-containing protein [Trinickia fusca]|uniref:GGDEF domain-containing protein n=1 Tax=Trinickia fusca TaxID=2419777 RepID=UPI001FE26D9B|nr:GGDEF domain-containing protein [Trinickia fusca]
MIKILLPGMPVSRRFGVSVALALVPILSLSYWLLVHEWFAYRAANTSAIRFHAVQATLLSMEKVSAERGPTNGVLGEDLPIPPARLAALARARADSDNLLARLIGTLRPEHCSGCADDFAAVTKLRRDLAAARANVDRLARLPRTSRGDWAVQNAVDRMIALVPEFLPVATAQTSVIGQGAPNTLNSLIIARLAADLREQAGQLGSRFTSALAMHRPLTNAERFEIERTRGRIDQLHDMIDARMVDRLMLSNTPYTAMNTLYFGDGQRYVDTVQALADEAGGVATTTGEFAEQYVPTMHPISVFRDDVLERSHDELRRNRDAALAAVVGTAAGEALILAAFVWMIFKFRRDVITPFISATRAIRAIAKGDLTTEIPSSFTREEIRNMFDAIRVLKANSEKRMQLEIERAQLMQELAHMAETDSLTQLLNRRAFESRARELCSRTDTGLPHFALVMFDVDHFKTINDTYGHAVGDEALRTIATLCRTHWRQSDIVARIGGEEFAIMTRVRAPEDARALAERMRASIGEAYVSTDDGTGCRMTASFGVAVTGAHAPEQPDLALLLKRADRLLYEAKVVGRDRVMCDADDAIVSPS